MTLAGGNPYEVELGRFVDCIAGRADPQLLDAERAIEALTLSLEVRRALGENISARRLARDRDDELGTGSRR